jgi:DNA-binding transcriptional LysR family regulator
MVGVSRPERKGLIALAVIAIGYDRMELHQLRYFVAVAEARHFTKAARGLRIAQPSVSRAIRVLEDELGTPLFHRMKGNVALTAAGETLLPWARRVLADVDGAAGEVRELADLRRGRLAVGATPSLTITLLPPALAKFHAAYPGVDLVLHEAGSRDLVGELEQGALDVALVIMPVRHETLETAPLLREELVVAVPHDHPLASRKTVAIADLKGLPLVMFRDGYDLRAATVAACRRAGFEPTFALEGGEMDGVLRFTAAGLGVAVVPSLVIDAAGPLKAVRLSDPLTRTIGFANRRDRRLSRAGREFVEVVRGLVRARDWLRPRPPGLTVLEASGRG